MAKDKSKKKEASDLKIKKLKSKKDSKKKDNKKNSKKKEKTKKEKTKKEKTKKDPAKKLIQIEEKVVPKSTRRKPNSVPAAVKVAEEIKDHSSDYSTTVAIVKLRSMKSRNEMITFVKGEKRTTVTRVLPAILNKLKE